MAGEGAKNIAIIVLFVFAIAMTAIALEAYNKANLDKEGGGRKTTKTFLIAMLVILSVGLLVTAFFLFRGGSGSTFVTEASQNLTAAGAALPQAPFVRRTNLNAKNAKIAELEKALVRATAAPAAEPPPPLPPAKPSAGPAAGSAGSGGS